MNPHPPGEDECRPAGRGPEGGAAEIRGGPPAGTRAAPTWTTLPEARSVVGYPPHLRRTALTALIVGTILFAINQLDVVLSGAATTATWVKAAVTYLVPFAVANVGVLLASRRQPDDHLPGGVDRR